MPQNLIDTPAEWQDTIVVPAPGDPAAIANDSTKPHSLFHALAALARRTRWLRWLLETHNHDGAYAPLAHNHDDRYYTAPTVWAATGGGMVNGPSEVSIQVTIPVSGLYLIEGHMIWGGSGELYWNREFWVDGSRVWSDARHAKTGEWIITGSWVDQIIYHLTAGAHSVRYRVFQTVVTGPGGGSGLGMIKITRL